MVYTYLKPALATITFEPVTRYKNYLTKDGRMVVNLDQARTGCIESAKLWYQRLRGTLEELGFMHNPEEGCCFVRVVGNMRCTVIVYVDDLQVTSKNETTIAEVIETLKVKYHDVEEHMGAKHLYLGMSPDVCSTNMPMLIIEILKDLKFGSVVTPVSGTLFMINESSPPLDDARRTPFHFRWHSYCISVRESVWIS